MHRLAALLSLLTACSLSLACQRARPDLPLTAAAAAGNVPAVRRLLAQGVDPNGFDRHGWTALMWAVRFDREAATQALLDASADPNLPDRATNGWTPLQHALHTRAYACARLLIDAEADVNQRSCGGLTALILVAGDGHPEMVQALLNAGADPAAEIPGGHTALSIAVAGGAFTDIDRPPGQRSKKKAGGGATSSCSRGPRGTSGSLWCSRLPPCRSRWRF